MNYLVINTNNNKVVGMHTAINPQDKQLFLQNNPQLILLENVDNFPNPIGYLWNSTTNDLTVVDNSELYSQLSFIPTENRVTVLEKLKATLQQQQKLDQVLNGIQTLSDEKLKVAANTEWQAAADTPIAIESPISIAIKQILTINDTQLLELFAQANQQP